MRREVRGDGDTDSTCPSIYGSICTLEATPSELAAAAELRDRIERALDSLEPHHRDVILRARVVGMSRRAIGEELGISEGAVRALLGRASVRLLAALEGRDRSDA